MLIDIVLGSKAVWRILLVLSEAPGQGITKEEIRKITKLGGNSLFKSINLLTKNNIINYKKFGKRTYYYLNLNNKYSKNIVEIINLEKKENNNMDQKILIILRELIRKIIDLIDVENIYVFGSIVKHSYSEKSDIDLALIIGKELSVKEKVELEKIKEGIEKRFKRKIETHVFKKGEFNYKNKLAEQVQRDGVMLI